jgi:hypothetical protein
MEAPQPPSQASLSPVLLRAACVLLVMGALLPTLGFISFVGNEHIEWTRYDRSTGELFRALFYLPGPLTLTLVPFLWARQRWAWWGSLLLLPLHGLGPLMDLATLRHGLHGGEALMLMQGLGAFGGGLVVGLMLWSARDALPRLSRGIASTSAATPPR